MIRFADDDEIKKWDELILANSDGGNVFSSYEFAMQKFDGGYKSYDVHFLIVNDMAITVLEKPAPGLGKLWYLPKGPNVTSLSQLWPILDELKVFAAKRKVFAIRIEPELDRKFKPELQKRGMIAARHIIPNPSTITLDISDGLDEIMERLPQKGRHAIRRAERDGVTVKQVPSTDKNCKTMYKLLCETAEGQFGLRAYEYFRKFWQRFETAKLGQLFFAYVDGQVVAGAYAMTFGKKSTYKDGASIRKRTAYGASHLLQWNVIQWAKSQGAELHDFCGSPPSDEADNPDHPYHGIGLFKRSFNKTVTDYVGCYDLVISPQRYKLWTKLGEKIARRLHYYKHHDSYY